MKSLVLCSGGIKSAFLAIEAAKEGEVSLLFIDHGQPSMERELAALEQLTERCNSILLKTKLSGFPPLEHPLLRLLCFFCQTVPIARLFGYHKLYHGLSRDDLSFITDPKLAEEFVTGLQRLLSMSLPEYDDAGLWLGGFEMDTPLRKLKLEHVLRLGNEWKIDWGRTWSCERGGQNHCGECPKCLRRRAAFKREGRIKDPTIYAS